MASLLRVTIWSAVLTCLSGVVVEAADWPRYRGPVGLGTTVTEGLTENWESAPPREEWRESLGAGYSGIVVVGDRVVSLGATDGEEAVICLDAATGSRLWKSALGEPSEAELGDPGPRSTPAVVDGVVYAVSSRALLVALDLADGTARWQVDLQQWGPVPRFGYSVSPWVEGDLVIVEVGDQDKEPGVAAFDSATGEVRWTALGGPAGYASALAVEIGGVRQIVLSRGREVVSLSLEGEVLWRHETPPRGAIPMPVFLAPDRLFVSTADDSFGGLMIRIVAEDGSYRTEEVWSERLMRNHFNSSVVVGDHLFGFDNGTLRCLDAATGERRWARRGFGKGSVVASGDRLYVLGDDGLLALVRATGDGYQELGRLQVMTGRAWTEPSLAGGHIYLRDFDEIVSLDLRGGGPPASHPADGEEEGR